MRSTAASWKPPGLSAQRRASLQLAEDEWLLEEFEYRQRVFLLVGLRNRL